MKCWVGSARSAHPAAHPADGLSPAVLADLSLDFDFGFGCAPVEPRLLRGPRRLVSRHWYVCVLVSIDCGIVARVTHCPLSEVQIAPSER
jgi:hypothetical protein